MKKYIILVLLMVTFIFSSFSQSVKIDEIKIGQKIPDILVNNIINAKKSSQKLNQFYTDRLLILDFFATWCGPCIKALPSLDSLQRNFKDKIQIVVVSYENKKVLESFFNNDQQFKNFSLPIISKDSVLRKFFPHRSIPHEVWIDKNGIVKAITGSEEVTEENISAFLTSGTINAKKKYDNLSFTDTVPLFRNDEITTANKLIYTSFLSKGAEGLPGSLHVFSSPNGTAFNQEINRVVATNVTDIILLYSAFALPKYIHGSVNWNNIVFEGKDSLNLKDEVMKPKKDAYDKWYCYELSLPSAVPVSKFCNYIMADLNKGLEIKGMVAKRRIKGWSLIKINKDEDLPTQPVLENSWKFSSIPLLLRMLNSFNQIERVFNDTNFSNPTNIIFNMKLNVNEYPDIATLKNELRKNGLDLIPVERDAEVLVITKNDKN